MLPLLNVLTRLWRKCMSSSAYKNRWFDKVSRFNQCFPPGTPVVYTTPYGMHFETEIRYPAVVLSNGVPVIWLRDIQSYCRLDRVVVV